MWCGQVEVSTRLDSTRYTRGRRIRAGLMLDLVPSLYSTLSHRARCVPPTASHPVRLRRAAPPNRFPQTHAAARPTRSCYTRCPIRPSTPPPESDIAIRQLCTAARRRGSNEGLLTSRQQSLPAGALSDSSATVARLCSLINNMATRLHRGPLVQLVSLCPLLFRLVKPHNTATRLPYGRGSSCKGDSLSRAPMQCGSSRKLERLPWGHLAATCDSIDSDGSTARARSWRALEFRASEDAKHPL